MKISQTQEIKKRKKKKMNDRDYFTICSLLMHLET